MSSYTQLEWLQGCSTGEVVTDILFESVMCRVQIQAAITQRDDFTETGAWPAIVAAGSQSDENLMFSFTSVSDSGGIPVVGAWYHNAIYWSADESYLVPDTDSKLFTYWFKKMSDDASNTEDVFFKYEDNLSMNKQSPGWTTPKHVGPFPLTFFCAKNQTDGRMVQHSQNARFGSLQIFDKDDDSTIIRNFIPVLNSVGKIGILETISNKFFQFRGDYKYMLNGQIFQGFQELDEITVDNRIHKIEIGFDEQIDRLSKTVGNIDVDLSQLYVGKTLDAQIENLDNMTVVWKRSVTTYNSGMSRANLASGKTYTIQESDLQHFLTVRVSDSFGNMKQKIFYVSNLPVVYIDTRNSEVIGKLDVDANIRIQGNAEFGQQYDGKAEIHVRGDSSAEYTTQLPYKIKLKKKTNLFGFGANRHWVLISNFVDTSLMRNMLATRMAADIGVSYAKMKHVVVVLNGVNIGVYMLAEHIRVNENRVNIFNWEDEAENRGYKNDNLTWVDQDESIDVSGGYLYEFDQGYDETTQFTTNGGIKVMLRRPEYARGSFRMVNSEMEFWRKLEKTFASLDYSYNESNLVDMIDVDSLAKLLLVNIVFGNIDVSTRSLFASKDINGKVVFGPIWDFDLAADSVVYSDQYPYDVWGIFRNTSQCFYKELLSFPYICTRLYNVYRNGGRQSLISILEDFDQIASSLSAVGSMNDFARRTDTYNPSWLNNTSITLRNNPTDTQCLKTYLQNRLNWLDLQFSSIRTFMTSMSNETTQVNPYNRFYSVRFIIDGNDNKYNMADVVSYSKKRSFIQVDIRYASQEPYDIDILLNGKIVQTQTNVNERVLFQYPIDDYRNCDYVTLEVLIHNKAPEIFEVRSYIVLKMSEVKSNIENVSFAGPMQNVYWMDDAERPFEKITYDGFDLVEGVDYVLTDVHDFIHQGSNTVTINGINGFTGTKSMTYIFTSMQTDENAYILVTTNTNAVGISEAAPRSAYGGKIKIDWGE